MECFSEFLNSDPPPALVDNIQPKWDQLDIDMSDPNEEETAQKSQSSRIC